MELTRKLLKERGHFIIEAKGTCPGGIVLPGHVPMSSDPVKGDPAYPGIVLKFSKRGRRTFDVYEAAEEYATKVQAAIRGPKSASQRAKIKDEYIDEVILYLNSSRYWESGDIELYRSPDEINAEREKEQLADIPTDKMLADLQRRGILPKGKVSQEDVSKALRAFLKEQSFGKGSAKEQANAGG